MNLIKTSFYTSISTAITFVSGFIITKVVAVKIGPSGVAYVGQFQNSIAIFSMFSTFAITTGVVKYLSTYNQDQKKQQEVLSTALNIILVSSFIVSLVVLVLSTYLSGITFKSADFWLVYFLYGVFVSIISLNTLFNSLFNGLKKIRELTIVNIISSLCNIACTVSLAFFAGVKGVLLASNLVALVVFIVNICFIRKIDGFNWKPDFRQWNIPMIKKLMAFTVMGMASGLLVPITQLLIRNHIITHFSVQQAGCWQAVTKISDYYLGFITTVLSVYYLPRLSEINNSKELKAEILYGYKIILPVVGIMALTIWLCREWVVALLFSKAFMPMLPLFKYQLLGDFFKIGSWLLGFIMLSKALTKTFLITELIFSVSFVLLAFYLTGRYGIIGATYAFCINYVMYWIMMWILMKKRLT